MITEFATRSGGATLPLRFREAKENIGISKEIYSFVLPLGSTINMDGAAIYSKWGHIPFTNGANSTTYI